MFFLYCISEPKFLSFVSNFNHRLAMPFSFLFKFESFSFNSIFSGTSRCYQTFKLIATRNLIKQHFSFNISFLQSWTSSLCRRLSFLSFNIVRVLRSGIIERLFGLTWRKLIICFNCCVFFCCWSRRKIFWIFVVKGKIPFISDHFQILLFLHG